MRILKIYMCLPYMDNIVLGLIRNVLESHAHAYEGKVCSINTDWNVSNFLQMEKVAHTSCQDNSLTERANMHP